jgi:O-antigen ligase
MAVGTLIVVILMGDYVPAPLVSLLVALLLSWEVLKCDLRVPSAVMRLVWLPGILIVIGLPGVLDNDSVLALKDIWRFGKYPLLLSYGFLWAGRMTSLAETLSSFIWAAGCACAVYLIAIASGQRPLNIALGPLSQEYGRGPYGAVIGLTLVPLAAAYRLQLAGLSRSVRVAIVLACLGSLALAGSRTLIGQLLIVVGVVVFLGLTRRARLVFLLGALAGSLIVGKVVLKVSAQSDWESLVGRTAGTWSELLPRTYREQRDITHYWRAYESAMAWRTYARSDARAQVLGHGFGEVVDTGSTMYLENARFRRIPVLHNGYLYLLVKTGLVGLVLHTVFLLSLVRVGMRGARDRSKAVRLAGRLMVALVVSLLALTPYISGLFSRHALFPVTLLIGALLRHLVECTSGVDTGISRGAQRA